MERPAGYRGRDQRRRHSRDRRLLPDHLGTTPQALAIVGKIAALWSESLDDSVALSAVNEIEALTAGLSQKIWQKIVIAERMA